MNIIGFWKTTEPYGSFSNWYHAEFDYDGHHFNNTEQAFMYCKAKLFNDKFNMSRILATSNPMLVKKLGRAVIGFDEEIWSEHKFDIMVDVNYEKFSQNEEIKNILLSTGNDILAEASPRDKIWGIGISADHADFCDPKKWPGENLLGKALMKARDRIKGI